jgi:hypothetical protein
LGTQKRATGLLLCGIGILSLVLVVQFFSGRRNNPNPLETDSARVQKTQAPPSPSLYLSESEFQAWAAKPDAVVFNLQYRGLSVEETYPICSNIVIMEDEPRPETPFIKSLGLTTDQYMPIHLDLLKGSEEGAVALDGDTVKALYLDLDCDGKLGPNEKLEPVRTPKEEGGECLFVTPDFTITPPGGGKSLFRMIVQVHGDERLFTALFGSFCVWEGKFQVAGTTKTLCLIDKDANGSFLDAGEDGISLEKDSTTLPGLPSGGLSGMFFQMLTPKLEAKEVYMGRALSSRMPLDGSFYQMRFTGEGTNESPLRAVFCKETLPTGRIELKLAGSNSNPKSQSTQADTSTTVSSPLNPFFPDLENIQIRHMVLVSTENPSIHLEMDDFVAEVPPGHYRIEEGTQTSHKEGFILFRNGPECQIVAGQTTSIELDKPKLEVKTKVYGFNDGSSFPCKEPVFLELKLVGSQGEEYRYDDSTYSREQNKILQEQTAQIQIFGPDGREVVTFNPDIVVGRCSREVWDTRNLPPGRYTIKAKRNTGSFAGELETELELTLTEK